MEKAKRMLYLGLFGALLTMVGDILLLGVDATEAGSLFEALAVVAGRVSCTRIGLAAFFGAVGIPLCAAGFLALDLSVLDRGSRLARLYRFGCHGYLALGGVVHVACCCLVYGIKKNVADGTLASLLQVAGEQAGLLIPLMTVWEVIYGMTVVTMLLLVARRKTTLPGRMWVWNPLVFKVLINLVAALGPWNAFFNGLRCSNMSLGAFFILMAWLTVLTKYRTAAEYQMGVAEG